MIIIVRLAQKVLIVSFSPWQEDWEINKLRFKTKAPDFPVDNSSPSIVRDPNKCVLCGDCVRVCQEVQGIGALDFAHRGSKSMVTPCFEKGLDSVECVYCGQCARVCPTGALMPKSDIDVVWKQIYNKKKTVVAQIAPAVRVALGESFGLPAGTTSTGQIVAALRAIGFDKVYDTSYAADLTVIEESNEFVKEIREWREASSFYFLLSSMGKIRQSSIAKIFFQTCPAVDHLSKCLVLL